MNLHFNPERDLEKARQRLLAVSTQLIAARRLAHSRAKKLTRANLRIRTLEASIAALQRQLAVATFPPAAKP